MALASRGFSRRGDGNYPPFRDIIKKSSNQIYSLAQLVAHIKTETDNQFINIKGNIFPSGYQDLKLCTERQTDKYRVTLQYRLVGSQLFYMGVRWRPGEKP